MLRQESKCGVAGRDAFERFVNLIGDLLQFDQIIVRSNDNEHVVHRQELQHFVGIADERWNIARFSNGVLWHIAGGAVIVLLLILFGRYHNDLGFLFLGVNSVTPLEAASARLAGGAVAPALVFGEIKLPSPLFALWPGLGEIYRAAPFALVFVLGLLQAQWTYTGYDASAHVAEETVLARLNCAWGVVLSVAVSSVVGYVLLVVLTWCIPRDLAATVADPYPVLFIVYRNLGDRLGHLVSMIIGGAMWLCGLASITSMARMWYAFARDDGMPGAFWLKQVHATMRTPVAAILFTSGLAVLICAYAAAFSAITSISTVTLYLAYAIPIYLNWRNRRRGTGERVTPAEAPWNLGAASPALNVVAMLWVAFITIVFVLPPNELVMWTLLGLAVALAGYWHGVARTQFRGPGRGD